MSMRSQVYEWDAGRTNVSGQAFGTTQFGSAISIFVGGFGNNITKPAETTATQFCVIEDIAVTPSAFTQNMGINAATNLSYRGLPTGTNTTNSSGIAGPRGYVQIRINTTDYFLDPDNVGNDGVPGSASPYPRSVNFQPCFTLYRRLRLAGRHGTFVLLLTKATTTLLATSALANSSASSSTLCTTVQMLLSPTNCWRWVFPSTQVTLTGTSEP